MTSTPFHPHPSDDALNDLNTLLDAAVSGKPAPESVPVSDADALAATAHLVSVQSASSPGEYPSDEALESIWRNVMHAYGITGETVAGATGATGATATTQAAPPGRMRTIWRSTRFNTLVSAAAVALLLVGMLGAAWGLRSGGIGNGGGGKDDGPNYLAAVTMQDGSTVEIEYRLPRPEDCTVEPLTVDEVMARLEGESVADMNASRATAIASAIAGSATPPPAGDALHRVGPLSRETYDELAATQREWLACKLYGSPFQIWALETDAMLRGEIQRLFMPGINVAGIREELEKAAAAHQSDAEFVGVSRDYPTDTWLPMVPAYSEGYYNVQEGLGRATLTVFWMNEDGEMLLNFGKSADDPQMEPYMTASQLERLLPNAWTFVYDEASGRWLLNDMRYMAG
ncbi:MAG TPA: hypothetical protein VM450_03615 [Thermomicrobiales bacterium]|nr:hypothetical protein [Thermomicrobiales bacterium]